MFFRLNYSHRKQCKIKSNKREQQSNTEHEKLQKTSEAGLIHKIFVHIIFQLELSSISILSYWC